MTDDSTAENGDADIASDSGGWELLDQPSPTSNDSPVQPTAEVLSHINY